MLPYVQIARHPVCVNLLIMCEKLRGWMDYFCMALIICLRTTFFYTKLEDKKILKAPYDLQNNFKSMYEEKTNL
jgi:hypothetical protein